MPFCKYLFKLVKGTVLLFVLEHAVHTFFVINLLKRTENVVLRDTVNRLLWFQNGIRYQSPRENAIPFTLGRKMLLFLLRFARNSEVIACKNFTKFQPNRGINLNRMDGNSQKNIEN